MRQLRQILRGVGRAPVFTLVTLLVLAVGLGATTAIFSIVNGVLLEPLPYPQPTELVAVRLRQAKINLNDSGISEPDYYVYRDESRTFQDIGLYTRGINADGLLVTITGNGEPERVPAVRVTDGVLSALRITPLLGRFFTREDNSPGRLATVVLGHEFWQGKFGGDRSVIGRPIAVDQVPRTIIGVLPPHFRFVDGTSPAVLLPIELNRANVTLGNYFYRAIARLKPGVTVVEANADVNRMIPMVFRAFPRPGNYTIKTYEDRGLTANVQPLKQYVLGDVGTVLWILMASIGLVLVVACANLVHLILVRAHGRQQELAIRAALGASRARVAAELCMESLLLAVLGGLTGLGVAYGALRVLSAMAPAALPRSGEVGIDGTVVLFALALSTVVGLLFGFASAFKHAGGLSDIGRQGDRSMTEGRDRRHVRSVLVVVQVALAVVLLVGSGLTIRTFRTLTALDPGFVAPSEVQTFRVFIAEPLVQEPARVARLYEAMLAKLQVLPGVSSVSVSRSVPMDGSNWNSSYFTEDGTGDPTRPSQCRLDFVGPGFFKTLGTPILAGRDFTWDDIHNQARVTMISERVAREHWRDAQSAVGKRIKRSPKGEWQEIIGVVRDLHEDGVDKQPPATVYWPVWAPASIGEALSEMIRRDVIFVMRTSRAGSEALMNEVRSAVWSVDSQIPIAQAYSLDHYYTRSMARRSFALVMLAVAGGMALLLSIAGLYGVIAYSVSQRRREIGIRMALGAGADQVRNMTMRQGLKLATLGVVIGGVAALGLTRYLTTLLYGVKPTDPPTFVAVSLLLIAVAVLACYIPARRAATLDPVAALRHE